MFRIAIFGGADYLMGGRKKIYLALFGGMDLYRPTLAKRLLERKYGVADNRGIFGLPRDLVLVAFGGVDIHHATLADEFVDLRVLLSAGLLKREEWDEAVYRLASGDPDDYGAFCIFGGIEVHQASADKERERIEAHRQVGLISEQEADYLDAQAGRSLGNVAKELVDMATLPQVGPGRVG